MTSIATQSLDDFTDTTGQIIEPDHFLVVQHINPVNDVAYSFYRVLDIKSDALTYGFLFYGDRNYKNMPLESYDFDRTQTATIEQFGRIKDTYNVYIAMDDWKTIFDTVKDDWEHHDPKGKDFHRRMSPLLEQRGPSPQQGGKKEFKNYGGGGKKLTRKNRKYLMKLYRKNRTRKHRGGGKAGKPRTVCWDKIYWHDLNLICDEAITQLRTKYGMEEENREATKLENLKVNEMAASNREKNIQLVRQLKILTKKVGNNAYEITLTGEQNAFLNQFCIDTPCCVVSGGGKLSPTKQGGGGKELPTFKSTKTKLKEILEKVKPDNEYYEFSQKLNEELNKIKEKKFNEFVNNIYENFDKIMSIPIKQKGGMPRRHAKTPPHTRTRRSTRNDSLECPICFGSLIDPLDQRILECSGQQGQHKVHEDCIRLGGVNKCPMCRHDDTYLDAYGIPIVFNPVQPQIYYMAAEIVEGRLVPPQGMHEYHRLISERRIRALRDRSLAVRERVRENINLYWCSFMFLFTCHSLGAAWRGQYSSNILTVIAMFYGAVIVVGLCPETPGSVSMTDQLVELIVRIMTFLDDMPEGMFNAGGGKKTRRKRYKRKRRTKRKMRKKRGGVRGKKGNKVEKAFEMEELDENGNPTGTKRMDVFKGEITNVFKTGKYDYRIQWSDGSSTKEKEDGNLKIMTVPIGDMHQAEVPSYIQSSTDKLRGSMPLSMEYMQSKPQGEMTPAQQLNTLFQNSPTDHLKNPEAAKAFIAKLKSGE